MRMIRTIVWLVVLVMLVLFSVTNWIPVTVRIWEDLVWETRLPAIVVLAFLAGLVPMWLLHATGRWRMRRRITALEAAARQPSAALTSTQLDAAGHSAEMPATD